MTKPATFPSKPTSAQYLSATEPPREWPKTITLPSSGSSSAREAIPPRLVVRLVLGARHHREKDLEFLQLLSQAADERLAALTGPLGP